MPTEFFRRQMGASLVELIAFIVVIAVALVALVSAFTNNLANSVDPLVQTRALECAQAKLDEILARRFDENSPTGGFPPCDSGEAGAPACAGIVADSDFDDVGDFHNQSDSSNSACTINTSVVNAGADLGIAPIQARRIEVNVISPGGGRATLSAYKTNF